MLMIYVAPDTTSLKRRLPDFPVKIVREFPFKSVSVTSAFNFGPIVRRRSRYICVSASDVTLRAWINRDSSATDANASDSRSSASNWINGDSDTSQIDAASGNSGGGSATNVIAGATG